MNNNLELTVQGRWQLNYQIAEGGYGAVYAATDLFNGQEVAIKMMDMNQHVEGNHGNLMEEAAALRGVHEDTHGGKRGIPRVLFDGQEDDYYVLVTDLLGPSLDDLQTYCGGRFSDKTVLMIGIQAVSLLEVTHDSGWLHRDIKPHNFLFGTGHDGNLLYSIDMGLSCMWSEAERDYRRHPKHRNNFVGTYDFASLNAHRGIELTYKDDLESLGYVLIFMCTGELPWSPRGSEHLWTPDMIAHKKETTRVDQLCAKAPEVFIEYFQLIEDLDFYDRPNYAQLREILQYGLRRIKQQQDDVWDWTKLMWRELYPATPEPSPLPPIESSDSE